MALVQKWFVFDDTDLNHKEMVVCLKHPTISRWGDTDCVFNEYGYDTKEEALAAIEKVTEDKYFAYRSYFVLDRWGRVV